MKTLFAIAFALLAGCSVTDRIADTKEVTLFRVQRTCTAYVPREWLDDQATSRRLAEKLDSCLQGSVPILQGPLENRKETGFLAPIADK